jgi:hypothetical protein
MVQVPGGKNKIVEYKKTVVTLQTGECNDGISIFIAFFQSSGSLNFYLSTHKKEK